MKTTSKLLVLSSFAVVASVFLSSCQKEMADTGTPQYASVIDVSADGTSTVISRNMQLALVETPALTDSEASVLLKMKEEEKLARDIYAALYEKWRSVIFSRISAAENNHLNAIINLLQYYGLGDTLVAEPGTFSDTNVQLLYNDLLGKAYLSIGEAYKTGALIEEMDIKDLQDAIATTPNENIVMVYENLERGSRNHLRVFNQQLTSLGITYIPVYLNQTDFDQIVSTPMEKGKQYKMKGKNNGNGSCNGTGSGHGKRKGKN